MALKVADRVRENTSSTGVGGISFTGSPAGFQTFSSVLTSGDITYYTIEENDKWEVGIGTYGSSNLERNYILGSSNSGNKISLGGSGTVFITYPAEKSVYRNQESQAVVGASGLVFDNGTIIKDAKITELYDVNVSGTPASTHLLSFDVTNKSLLIGDSTGPSNNGNVLMGYGAGSGITTSNQNVVIGTEAAIQNQGGSQNVHIGYQSGPVHGDSSSVVYNAVSVGYQAGHKMRHYSTAVGHQAGIDAYEVGFVAVGYHAGSGIGSYSTVVGMDAGQSFNDDYATIIGYQAAYNGGGQDSVWVGRSAGYSSTGAARSVGVGKEAGKGSTASDSIYIGKSAGQNNTNDDSVFIGNASPASMGTLFKGDMNTKRIAVGVADVSLTDAFYIGINSNTDKGLVVKSAASQSADLTQWTTSSDGILASVSSSGIVSANGLVASGAGLQVTDNTPVVTANTLYSVGGGLYWNGSPLAGGGGTVTPEQLEYVSGIAVYASGEVGSGDVTTDQLNYVSGIAVYSSGQATSLNVASGVANYASGVVTGGTPTFGNMYVDQYIYHNGDNDTYIRLRGDQFDFVAGGRTMLTLDEAGSDIVTVNDGANDVDFQVKGDSDTNLIRTDAANDSVGIGTSSPAYKLDVVGHDAWVQSSGIHVGASGIVVGAGGDINLDQDQRIYFEVDKGTWIETDAEDRLRFVVGGNQMLLLDEDDDRVNIGFGNKLGVGLGNNTSPAYDLDVQGMAQISGVIVGNSGIVLASNTPSVTTNTLYNDGGTLKFNGSTIGEGDVTTAQLNYVSGIAVYSSGQAIANETDIVTNVSNISTNTSNVSANTSNISTNTTNITSVTNTANYASGQAIDNEGDIVAVSGIAAYASGHAHDDLYVSGVAAYASGNTSNIVFGSNVEGDILYHNGTSFTRLPKGTDSHVLTMDGNVPAWEAAAAGDVTTAQLVYVSGIAVYASGHVHDDLYVSGIATYASGQAIANETDIATNVSNISTNTSNISTNTTNIATNADNIVATSGIANYASGLAITNESNVAYASGQAIANETDIATNVSNISTNTSNISTNTTNIASTTAVANYASGEALSLTYASGLTATNASNITTNASDIVAVSGIAHYASGHAHDDLYVSGVAAYASGQAIANETDIATNVSNISTNTTNITSTTAVANYASGEALSLNAASGQAVYASGQVNVTTDGTAEASKALILDADKSFSGVKNGRLSQFDSWLYSSGVNVGNSGVVLANSTPSNIGNTLYNVAGTLYFNGTQLASAGGASPTAQYASGQAIENQGDIVAVSGIAHYASGHAHDDLYVSGIAAYASGQAIANESDIATNASNISTNTSNISTNTTNIATNADNIVATSGIANYASGQAIANKTDIATNTSNISTNTSNISTNTSNISTNTTNISINSNRVIYASGQAIDNKSDIVAVSGIAHYASGHAHDDLYVSGVAAYASGQAIANETDIATNVSNISTNTSNISTNTTNIASTTAVANYASGQAIENESDIVATSGIANYASGLAITNEANVAYASGNTSNITFGSNAEGDILYHDGSTFTRLAKGTDNHVLTMNGNVPNWEAGGSTLSAGSGIAIVDNKVHFESKSSGGTVLSSIKEDNDNHVTLMVSGTIVSNAADTARIGVVSIGSGSYMTGNYGVAIGQYANTTSYGTAIGYNTSNSFGSTYGVAIGFESTTSNEMAVAIGKGVNATTECVAIGGAATATVGGGSVSIGTGATSASTAVSIGNKAGQALDGHAAGGSVGVSIGYKTAAEYAGIAIGYETKAGDFAIALGKSAVAGDAGFVVASGSTQAGVMLSGVFGSHLSLPNGQQFRQIASAAQTSDLMQWQNSAGTNVAAMTPSGVLNVYAIRDSGHSVCVGYAAQISEGVRGGQIALLGTATGQGAVCIGGGASAAHQYAVVIGGGASSANNESTIVGHGAAGGGSASTAFGKSANAGSYSTAIGWSADADDGRATAIGTQAAAAGTYAIALGSNTDALGERSVAIGYEAQAHGTSWVIASGDTSAEVGISGVFGSYAAIPNDQKLAVGGNVPTYTVDALGHGAMVRATGVIVGNSGVVLSDNVPSVTDYTLYRDGSDLKWNGSAIGGSTSAAGAVHQIQYNSNGTDFGADAQFLFAKNNAAFTNDRVLVVSGVIIANSGDANYSNPISIGSGAYVAANDAIAIGLRASVTDAGGVSIGHDVYGGAVAASHAVAIKGNASDSYAVAIGYATSATTSRSVAIGSDTNSTHDYSVGVGYNADSAGDYSVSVGPSASAGNRGIAIGLNAKAEVHRGIAIGDYAKAGNHAIALGGVEAPDGHFIVASGSNSSTAPLTDVMLSGVFGSYLTLPNGQQFRQIASAAQTTDLMQWQNSAGTNVASMTPSGILNVYDIRTSGEAVCIGDGAVNSYGSPSPAVNSVTIGKNAESTHVYDVAIGVSAKVDHSSTFGGVAIGNAANALQSRTVAIGNNSEATATRAIAVGAHSESEGNGSIAIGYNTDSKYSQAIAVGSSTQANADNATAIGASAVADGYSATAVGGYTDALGDRSIAIGYEAQAHGTSWVIASGDTSAEVGISGVFGSYAAIPNDQKLAVGGNVPTYTVDALGHGAMVRATGVIVGNSGIVLASNAPTVTTNTLYNDGGTLSWAGSPVGGGSAAGAIHQIQYNDGTGFAGDAQFLFSKANSGFTNDRVLVASGTIIANSGDANYANPVSIGSGAYVTSNNSVAIGHKARSVGAASDAVAIGGSSQAYGGSVAIGTGASSNTHYNSVAIGGFALANSEKCVAIGRDTKATNGGTTVGHYANGGGAVAHAICIGESSRTQGVGSVVIGNDGLSFSAAENAVVVGRHGDARGANATAIGSYSNAGQHSVALGHKAVAPDGGFVVASGSALTDVLLSGVMKTHLTMPNGQQFIQMATAAQTTDLMQWQNSAGTNVASMTPSGILNAYEIRTSGDSVCLGPDASVTSVGGGQVALLGIAAGQGDVAIGGGATTAGGGGAYCVAVGTSSSTQGIECTVVGRGANATEYRGTAFGVVASAHIYGTAIGPYTDATTNAVALGSNAQAAVSQHAVALGAYTDAIGERSVAIGYEAQAHGTSWVIASGNTAAEVGISGVFGSYTAIPNDQKLAVGGHVPTYTVDALGHGAMVRATGVIVGNSGVVLSDNVPSVTDYTLYRDGSDLKWNGSAIGGSSLTAGSGIAIVDDKVHFESKSSGGTVLSSIKRDNDTHVTLLVSGTIVSNAADAVRPGMVVIGSGAYASPTFVAGHGYSTVVGAGAANVGGSYGGGTAIGSNALAYQYAVAVGHAAKADTHVYTTAVGYAADARNGKSTAIGGNSRAEDAGVSLGSSAVGENACVVIGEGASSSDVASVAIGQNADVVGSEAVIVGANSNAVDHGSAIGYFATAGKHSVALGYKAVAPDGGFVLASGSALTDVLLSGVMKTHLTMPNGQQFIQMATAAQTTDLMQWQNSAGTNVAAMTPSGILNVYDIRTSGTSVSIGKGASSREGINPPYGADASSFIAIGREANANPGSYTDYDIAIGALSNANGGDAHALAIGSYANAGGKYSTAIGHSSQAGQRGVAVGQSAKAFAGGYEEIAMGYSAEAQARYGVAIGSATRVTAYGGTALGWSASAEEFGLALGFDATATDQTWVIASGATAAAVGISGVFGSYTAIPNDQKLAVGGHVPTYTVDALGHGATVRGSGVIVGNSGVVLASSSAPAVTANTLYNNGGTLSWAGSPVGGGGAAPASGSIYEVQYNGDGTNLGADSDFTWNPSTNVMTVTGHISASTKSFLINHPTKPDKKLQYACLEGPENGVYVRGHTNDNLIDLPDYWTALVDPESITVQLTAKDAPQPFLYVSGVLNNQVHLISDREISAYYTVSATRKDVDPLLVEPDNY